MNLKSTTFYTRMVLTFCAGFGIGYIINMCLYTVLYTIRDNRFTMLSTNEPFLESNEIMRENLKVLVTARSRYNENHQRKSVGIPSVLCYLLIGPSTHSSAVHIKNTWGKRCDKLLFFSTEEDDSLEAIVLNIPEGYKYLWTKSREALLYLFSHYGQQYEWFLKADDDTYIIMENLRYFLNQSDFMSPVYYGVKFKRFVHQGYMSGGGGYVLSREALRRFAEKGPLIHNNSICSFNTSTGAEDMNLGKCLEAVGVSAEDSLDKDGLPRFFSHSPENLFFNAPLINHFHWYWRYIWHKHSVGPNCCSRDLISFHELEPRKLWAIDSLLYRVMVHREFSVDPKEHDADATDQSSTSAHSA